MIELIRLGKQTYYQHIFSKIKKTTKQYGKVYMKVYFQEKPKRLYHICHNCWYCDPIEIGENFNNFCTSKQALLGDFWCTCGKMHVQILLGMR